MGKGSSRGGFKTYHDAYYRNPNSTNFTGSQQQMNLVPSYGGSGTILPMQTMGGKGGGMQAPSMPATPPQPFQPQDFMLSSSYRNPFDSMLASQLMSNLNLPPRQQNPGIAPPSARVEVPPMPSPSYGGEVSVRKRTTPDLPSPSYGGAPAYTTAVTTPKQAVPDYVTPRPTGGSNLDRYRGMGSASPAQTSEMFGTTLTRTPMEQEMLARRQAELDALQAQQRNLVAQQQEYDQMFGGLTEEQQAYFGNQLQRPSEIPQRPRPSPMYLQNVFRQLLGRGLLG